MQSNAEQAVRELLIGFSKDQGLKEIDTVSAEEHMDDGTPIRLAVTINRKEGSALLDFEGTAVHALHAVTQPQDQCCWTVEGTAVNALYAVTHAV